MNSLNRDMKNKTWLDNEVDFYDFIWAYGVQAHTSCINNELFEDFKLGGNKFEEMKKLILEKFPTREEAEKVFQLSKPL